MRRKAQRSEHERVETFKQFHRGLGNVVGVGAVGEIPDAKAEDVEPRAMFHRDRRHLHTERFEGGMVNRAKLELWRCARMRRFVISKRVIKRLANPLLDLVFAVERDGRS